MQPVLSPLLTMHPVLSPLLTMQPVLSPLVTMQPVLSPLLTKLPLLSPLYCVCSPFFLLGIYFLLWMTIFGSLLFNFIPLNKRCLLILSTSGSPILNMNMELNNDLPSRPPKMDKLWMLSIFCFNNLPS